MTALELISFINQALFLGLFVVVFWHAARAPSRSKANIALLFGSIAAVLIISRVAGFLGWSDHPAYPGVVLLLLGLAPFAMVRLVDDFSTSPRVVQVASMGGFIALGAFAIAGWGTMERLVEVIAIAYFMIVGGYAGFAFAREAERTRGITSRRMTAVASGALLFIAAIILLLVGALAGAIAPVTGVMAQVAALLSAVAFFLGFAPPTWVRRAWREPELRRFLERSLHLAGVADERAAIAELNQAAASAFGASGAAVGIADGERRLLRYVGSDGDWLELPDDQYIAGRAYHEQRRIVAADATIDDPDHAEAYGQAGARAVIAAPITSETRRIGVLSVFAEHMSIFAEDDLWLIELLADQSAVLLEARTLAEDASSLRAREEAARLKEDFLSAAAHDLRTPLTVVLGQAELLERRRQRNPGAPVDGQGLARIAREARRLSDLVTELLDAQRLEQEGATMDLAPGDLLDVVEGVRERYAESGLSVSIDEPAMALVASIDRPRIEQVLDNLVDNALKYTVNGDAPDIHVTTEGHEALVAVVDHGIGIPDAERGRIFERFFRASNAQSITDTGLGLGLYICRRIIDVHGGRIWMHPTPGGGTTFALALPLLAVPAPTQPDPTSNGWKSRATHEAAADA